MKTMYEQYTTTQRNKRLSLAGIIAAGAISVVALRGQEAEHITFSEPTVQEYDSTVIPFVEDDIEYEHDHDKLLIALRKGATLDDIEFLYDTTDDVEFDSVEGFGFIPNVYVVNPSAANDPRMLELINTFENDVDILDAEFNYIYSVPENEVIPFGAEGQGMGFPNDPLYSHLWGMQSIGMSDVWAELNSMEFERPVRIAVGDTGASPRHEDLNYQNYWSVNPSWDGLDTHSHGTHVAGTIGAITDNGKGVSSANVNGAFQMFSIQMLGPGGRGSTEGIVRGIEMAAEYKMDVLNMSLGGPGKSTAMDVALKEAAQRGVTTVVAAGNSNTNTNKYYPAGSPYVISTGACYVYNGTPQRSPYSNFGSKVDICGPGGNTRIGKEFGVLSAVLNDKYAWYQGTSMASPHVAMVVATMHLADNFSHQGDFKHYAKILEATGSDTVKTAKRKPVGKYLNAAAAFSAAKN